MTEQKFKDESKAMTRQDIIDIINKDLQKLSKEQLQRLISLLKDD